MVVTAVPLFRQTKEMAEGAAEEEWEVVQSAGAVEVVVTVGPAALRVVLQVQVATEATEPTAIVVPAVLEARAEMVVTVTALATLAEEVEGVERAAKAWVVKVAKPEMGVVAIPQAPPVLQARVALVTQARVALVVLVATLVALTETWAVLVISKMGTQAEPAKPVHSLTRWTGAAVSLD